MVYPLGSRATRGITVQVTDETGKPVEGAAVSFALPEEGPTGTFSSGSKTEIVTTRADGSASVWGMQWNRIAGSFEVRITAAKGRARAGIVCAQYLTDAPLARQASGPPIARSGHKWLWIGLGVAAGAGAGFALSGHGNGTQPAAAAVGVVRIGAPSIAIGPPQ